MYKIYVDGIAIHNPAMQSSKHIVVSPTLTESQNSAAQLSFVIYPDNVGYAAITFMSSVVEAYDGDELIFRGRPLNDSHGWNNQKKIVCESDFAFFNDTVVRPYEYGGSVVGYLTQLITQHNAQVSSDKQFVLRTCTVTDPNDYISRASSEYPTTMSEIQSKLIDTLGGYMMVVRSNGTNYIDYLSACTSPSTQKIELTKNLLTFSKTNDGTCLTTCLLPLGAVDETTGNRITISSVNSGYDYLTSPLAQTYGNIFEVRTWDDVTLPANLLTKANNYLSGIADSVMSMELTAADLHQMDADIEAFKFLHNVTVVDSAHGASGFYLVTGKKTVFDDPSKNTIKIGTEKKGISGTTASIKKSASEVLDKSEQWTASAIQRAANLITGASGGYVVIHRDDTTGKPYEILIMDTDDINTAVKVWRWNVNGLGYSQTGYDGTYLLAATQDGAIVADFITAGVLDANVIKAGKIRSTNYIEGQQGFSFDLQTGDMQTPGLNVTIANVDGLSDALGGINTSIGSIEDKTSRISVTQQNGLQVFGETDDTYVQITGKTVNMVSDGDTQLAAGNGIVEVSNQFKSPMAEIADDLGDWKIYLMNGKFTINKVG